MAAQRSLASLPSISSRWSFINAPIILPGLSGAPSAASMSAWIHVRVVASSASAGSHCSMTASSASSAASRSAPDSPASLYMAMLSWRIFAIFRSTLTAASSPSASRPSSLAPAASAVLMSRSVDVSTLSRAFIAALTRASTSAAMDSGAASTAAGAGAAAAASAAPPSPRSTLCASPS